MSDELAIVRQTVAALDRSVITYLGQRALSGFDLNVYEPGWSFGFYKELITVDESKNILDFILPSAEAKYTTFALPLLCTEHTQERPDILQLDCNCMWAIMLRMRTSVRVALTKYRLGIGSLREAVISGDTAAVRDCITIPSVEEAVLDRILKTANDFARHNTTKTLSLAHLPDAMVCIYREWIIPMSCSVQVRWLFHQYGMSGQEPTACPEKP